MSNDAHVFDVLPAYALGSLEADDARRVEEHLLSCLICRNESSSFQAVADQLSFAAPLVTPPPDLRDRLMQRVQATHSEASDRAQAPKRPWLERFLPAWGLASLFFIVFLAGFNLFLWQRLNHLEAYTAPGGMRAVPLSTQVVGSAATGFVLISANGDDGALVVDDLPPLDEAHQYQLWLVRDDQKISGAVFSTDEKSYGGTRIRAPGSLLEYSAVDITVEPKGGSPQPTGAPVLGGSLVNP